MQIRAGSNRALRESIALLMAVLAAMVLSGITAATAASVVLSVISARAERGLLGCNDGFASPGDWAGEYRRVVPNGLD
jgi:adenosine/AMP kinase